MNLGKKKGLAKRTLKTGKKRIVFAESRLEDIKEAITKQDIRDLHKEGAIIVKEKKGRSKVVGRKRKRKTGKVKIKVKTRKKDYVTLTRKLRGYLSKVRKKEMLSPEQVRIIRNKIRNKDFRSQFQLKEYITSLKTQ